MWQPAENAVDASLVDDPYPLVADPTFIPRMHAVILNDPAQWATPRLYAAVEFAWGVLLRECAGRTDFTGALSLGSLQRNMCGQKNDHTTLT